MKKTKHNSPKSNSSTHSRKPPEEKTITRKQKQSKKKTKNIMKQSKILQTLFQKIFQRPRRKLATFLFITPQKNKG